MTHNLYALLVGIDKYDVSPLSGCVNDIKAVEQYLDNRLDREKYQPKIEMLLDSYATRKAIIEKFESHLCKARQDDIVLFYYCGHGSLEEAGEEFYQWQQNKKQLETIVCYDSRQTLEDGTEIRDLADKEMGYLISKVAQNQPHILIVYDCCHSGSGTRGKPKEGVRSYPIDIRPPRKYEDFLFAQEVTQNALKPENFPKGKHIFMSACLDSQTAKEMAVDGDTRGVFSYFLLKELENLNVTLPYRELLRQVNFRVNGKKKSQTPQIESIGYKEEELSKLAFFSDAEAIKSNQPYFVLTHRPSDKYENQKEEWIVNAGASQLQKGSRLALFEEYSTLEAMQDSSKKLGEVEITEVRLSESVVKFTVEPSNNNTSFYAVLTKRVLPNTAFYLEGEDDILAQLEQQLETSLYARIERNRDREHDYRLYARKQRFEITDTEDRLLVQPIEGYNNLSEAVRQVDHIARWTKIKDMENPQKTLSDDVIEIEISSNGKTIADSDLRLQYQYVDGEWQPPKINLKLKNKHPRRSLYCAFLEICDDYSINIPRILPEGGDDYSWICLKPGEEYRARVLDDESFNSEDIEFFIPEEKGYEDITEYKNYYKLIVSTSQFEVSQYEQSSLLLPENKRQTRRSVSYEDWMTKTLPFTIVKPKDAIELTAQKKLLSSGVTIKAPDGLKANARLVSTSSTIRSLNNNALPPLLSNTTEFQFATSRSIDRELSGLEMEIDLSTIDTVSSNSPITIEIDKALNPDELVLVVAKDGEFFFPLGLGRAKNGKTEIKIEGLCHPQPVDQSERKFSQAIWMGFRKVVLTNIIGQKSSYASLRKARVNADGTVNFSERGDLETVKKAVANAQKIILYIHGLVGDTESMIPSVRYAKMNVNGQLKSLESEYQVVLGFDYESLNTSIEDTAKELKKQLEAVGLKQGHQKTLHIVAHSMGGLVSRSFIEQWGGNKVVSHLIMVGTPNGGSTWATVHDLATTALFFGLNFSSVPVIPSLLEHLVKAMSVTLQEMHSTKASFLEELKENPDPHCPYSVIAGSTALMDRQAEIEKLLAVLKTKLRKMVEFPFKDNENDIAVAVKDIIDLPKDRSPAVYIPNPIACDHLSYFRREEGLQALSDAVSRAFGYS